MPLTLVLLLVATTAPALPHYTVHPTTAPIKLDGELTDSAWQGAAWTEDLINILGPGAPAPPFRTRCKVLYDDKNLYIAAELDETDVAATQTKHNSQIWKESCFELFIDPESSGRNYWEIEVNARNTTLDLQMSKPYSVGGSPIKGKHLTHLQTAVHVNGTLNDPSDRDSNWTIEMAIPFADIGITPRPGDQWRINFARIRYNSPDDASYASWSAMGKINYHIPQKFGYLKFAD